MVAITEFHKIINRVEIIGSIPLKCTFFSTS